MKMKLTVFCVVELFLFFALIGTAQSQHDVEYNEEDDNRDESKVVTEAERKIWSVAAKLYKGANKPELENVIFSPLSLTSSMVMLSAGAKGETAREIRNLFKLSTNSQFSVRSEKEMLNSITNHALEQDSGVKFVSASRIYADSQHAHLRKNYKEAVSSLGEVETLDFTQPKTVVETINEWVHDKTEGKISKIVEEKDFEGETAAVLVNTLYFKAPWKQEFDKKYTETADFHVSSDKKVQVEMMFISAEFPQAELTQYGATAVFLPYKGDRFNMIIYLPQDHDKLSTLEEKLKDLVPTEVRNEATTTKISLHLPKFNISSTLDFEQILTNLGVKKMFKSEEADFSGMSETEGFHVSKVRQNIFIEMNEAGTEAAAVTEIHGLGPASAPNTVKVDRPFIFQIYDKSTGAVLLSGKISNPNPDAPKAVTESEKNMWKVAVDLYKGANNPEVENVIFSPLSLTSSMVMLSAGAKGETAREIQTLFKIGNNSQFSVLNQKEVLESLKNQKKDSGVKFVSASRIYANEKNAKLRENYVTAVSSLGEVETLDFTQPKPVVETINEWVNNKTDGKISKIVKVKDFEGETSVVLLNTLYFNAPWKSPFNKSNTTQNQDFQVSGSKTEKVEMMYISAEFPYADLTEAEASAVFLPYKGDRLSMIIYLPFEGKNLSTLEEKLKDLVPSEVLDETTNITISLHLPKFNVTSSVDFKEIFTSLGVQNMFKRDEADFSEMSESAGFHVSKVRQNIFIKVDEEGTEAAAVTAATGLGPVAAPNEVKVDRPFIFQIYDSGTGAVLLSGRISNPNSNGHQRPGAEPDDKAGSNSDADSRDNSSTDSGADSSTDSPANSGADFPADSRADFSTDSSANSSTNSRANSSTNSRANSSTNSRVNSSTNSRVNSSTDSGANSSTDSGANSGGKPADASGSDGSGAGSSSWNIFIALFSTLANSYSCWRCLRLQGQGLF